MIEYSLLEWEVVICSLCSKAVVLGLCSSLYGFGSLTTSVQFDLRGMKVQPRMCFAVFAYPRPCAYSACEFYQSAFCE